MVSAILDPIATLLDALEAQLETVFPKGRWHYSEQNEAMSPEEFGQLISRLPHIGIGWASWRSDSKGEKRFQGVLAFKIWIVVKHPQLKGRLRGDPRGPGLYASAVQAAQLLQGLTVPGIGSVKLTNVAPAFAQGFTSQNLALALIEGSVFAQIGDVTGAVDGLPAFKGLSVDWDLARAAGNATMPDAEDEIALEGAS